MNIPSFVKYDGPFFFSFFFNFGGKKRSEKRTAKEEIVLTHVRTKAAIFTIDANICCSTQPGCTSAAAATAEVPLLSCRSCSCALCVYVSEGWDEIGMCRPRRDPVHSLFKTSKSIIFFATHFPSCKTNARCSIHVLCVCHYPCSVYVYILNFLSCHSLSSLSFVPFCDGPQSFLCISLTEARRRDSARIDACRRHDQDLRSACGALWQLRRRPCAPHW